MKIRTLAPIGIITLALLLALTTLGAVYAAWSQTLSVSGQVSTGTVAAAIGQTHVDSNDPLKAASCELNVRKTSMADDTVEMIVRNAYLGYSCTGKFKVANKGTLPLKVNELKFGSKEQDNPFEVESGGGCVGQRVDPGNESGGWCEVKVTIGKGDDKGRNAVDCDPKGGKGTFSGTINAEQWMP